MLKMNWTLSAIMIAGLCVVSAPRAQAQQATLGTFTLPVAAHFGGVVLQPGDYTVSTLPGTNVIRIRGERGIATILASSIDDQAGFKHGSITLATGSGTFVLERFESSVLGRRFDFDTTRVLGKHSERASAGQGNAFEIAVK